MFYSEVQLTAVLFYLKFTDNTHKFRSSKALKAILQSSKNTGIKQNLTQNGYARSFKVTCFQVSGKAIRDKFRRSQIFCRSQSASTYLCWSRDINKLYSKLVKINYQRAVCNSENLT